MSASIQSSRHAEPPQNNLVWALLASIVVHVLAMYGIMGPVPMPVQITSSRVDVTLRMLPDLVISQPPASVHAARSDDRILATSATRVDRHAEKKDAVVAVPVPDGTAASHQVAETGTKSAIDMEAIRNQIRHMDSDWTATKRSPAGPAASVEERPILSALANALGERPRVLQETVQNDGSRLIRFSGGRCLHVPAHVPYWRQGGPVPVEWVVTNCAD